MKAVMVLSTIVLSALIGQVDTDPLKVISDALQAMQDATAILKTVHDKASAEAAVTKLEEATKRLRDATEALKGNQVVKRSQIDRARLTMRSLEKAAQVFYITHHYYPQTLVVLTERQDDGSPALLDKSGLTDPWGRPYWIDSAKRNPKTGIPLIWSQGPDPKDSSGKITNWDAGKK